MDVGYGKFSVNACACARRAIFRRFVSRADLVTACGGSRCVAIPPNVTEIGEKGVVKRLKDEKALICTEYEVSWSSSRMLHNPAITGWRGCL